VRWLAKSTDPTIHETVYRKSKVLTDSSDDLARNGRELHNLYARARGTWLAFRLDDR